MATSVRKTTVSRRATSGYADLARKIRCLGLQRRRPGFYAVVLIANLMTLGGVITAMAFLRDSWWLMLLAVALAIVSAQIGFFGHDAGHHQVARRTPTDQAARPAEHQPAERTQLRLVDRQAQRPSRPPERPRG